MSDLLKDILAKRNRAEPKEIKVIKDFVLEKINTPVSVSIAKDSISILVPNSSAAGALRMILYELNNRLETEKKLLIRIG